MFKHVVDRVSFRTMENENTISSLSLQELNFYPTDLVNDSHQIIQLHMLQQFLDRYRFLNQKWTRFLIDLVFHVLEIDNEFFVLNYFCLSYTKHIWNFFFYHIKSSIFSILTNNTKMILMNVYTKVPLFNTPRKYSFTFSIMDPKIYFISSKNAGILQRDITLVLLLYDWMNSKYSLLKSSSKIQLMYLRSNCFHQAYNTFHSYIPKVFKTH